MSTSSKDSVVIYRFGALIALAILVVCADSSARGTTSIRPKSIADARSCWDAARDQSSSGRQLDLSLGGSVIVGVDDPSWTIKLKLTNTTRKKYMVSIRAAHGDSRNPGESDVFLSIKSSTGVKIKHLKTIEQGETAQSSDYAVIAPGKSIVLTSVVSSDEYRLDPGKYDVSVCFWDTNPSPPEPPTDTSTFRLAISAGPIELEKKTNIRSP